MILVTEIQHMFVTGSHWEVQDQQYFQVYFEINMFTICAQNTNNSTQMENILKGM
jgi:hypothetical protein